MWRDRLLIDDLSREEEENLEEQNVSTEEVNVNTLRYLITFTGTNGVLTWPMETSHRCQCNCV